MKKREHWQFDRISIAKLPKTPEEWEKFLDKKFDRQIKKALTEVDEYKEDKDDRK